MGGLADNVKNRLLPFRFSCAGEILWKGRRREMDDPVTEPALHHVGVPQRWGEETWSAAAISGFISGS